MDPEICAKLYLKDLSSFEFFRLVTHFARFDLAVQTVAIFTIMLWKSTQISKFLPEMSVVLGDLIPSRDLVKQIHRNAVLAFGWTAICLIVHLAGFLVLIWDDLQTWESFTKPITFLTLVGPSVPMYLDDIVGGVSKMLNLNTEMAEPCFYFILISLLTAGFHEINQHIQKVPKIADDFDVAVGCIGIANSVVRTFLCLRCHGKVLDEEGKDSTVKDVPAVASKLTACTPLYWCKRLQKLSKNMNLPPGPKQHVMGLLVGYAILIHQTRDAMVGDDRQYAKKTDFPHLARLILGIIQNQTGYLNETLHE
ncbi:hypothetical protein RvY_01735 [Ramazzottius varieornatus]|uniref:Uncharacterized protein n=1 Tax=Ramazzottius varieornatus TaxID=947166 RepID=A0A1D1UI61_RAMVA|nr:hypothetical protein RvY_01735 [Ramazzottius varieornatus]